MIGKLLRGFAWGVLAALVALIFLTVLTAHPGSPALWPPAAGAPSIEIHVVSHGYHFGVVISREAAADVAGRRGSTALLAVTQRFGSYRWLEFGWGDEGFYRSVPDVTSLTIALAARALFRPGNPSVVHVVGLSHPVRETFPRAEVVRIAVSTEGFARLVEQLEASFVKEQGSATLSDLGPGLYGPSLFFRGTGAFHIFNVCNHWVAGLLSAAGLPTAPVPATLPQGLFFDLRWRSGLVPLNPPNSL